MGVKDIGFGMTISNYNHQDLMKLYEISHRMGMEFATAAYHNSYYFHKEDNLLSDKAAVNADIEELINALLKENNPKSWFRAFFNLGLINYINGGRRMLPCEAGVTNFFIEPYGEIYPCNGLENSIWKLSMGNLREVKRFDEIWCGERAGEVRKRVASCPKNCWMVGTVAPVMRKYIMHPAGWVLRNKWNSILGKKVCVNSIPWFNVGQNPCQGSLNFEKSQKIDDHSGARPDSNLKLIEA
jgi:radical SAM protein with 4Fe4S-binding SPASM domain